MSDMGQLQTSVMSSGTSAFCPKADIMTSDENVRF